MKRIYTVLFALVAMLCTTTVNAVTINKTVGWFESGAVEWAWESGATFTVYYRPQGGTYVQLDKELVRQYNGYGRADAVGLKAGKYQFKVVKNGTETAESDIFTATAHDRSGFAHVGMTGGIGAYKNDGTLKDGAKVFYVTAKTASTISMDVKTSSKGATTSCTGIQSIIDAYQKGYETTPIVFRLIGKIQKSDLDHVSSSAEGLQVKGKGVYSDMPITFEGIGNDATVQGFGFLVRNCHGAEFRNFAIMVCMDDCLSLDTGNSNVWIHNMDFFYGGTGGDADQAKGDGTVDIKGKSMNCTISYNHFYDNGKTSLGGMEGGTGENGCFHTYHHNWFDHSDSRHPRIRSQFFHVYNNYYDGVSKYGVGAAAGGASAFVEKNYFRNTKYPVLSSKQGTDAQGDGTFSGETGGVVKVFDNIYSYPKQILFWTSDAQSTGKWDAYNATTREEQVPSDCKSYDGGYPYNYAGETAALTTYIENKMDYADEVPAIVRGNLGAGRMQHGDFDWKFNNSLQDENYAVITELKSAIVAYESTLIGFADGTLASDRTPASATVVGGDGQGISEAENDAVLPSWAGGGTVASGKQVIGTDGNYFWFNAENEAQLTAYNTSGAITTTGETVVFDKTRTITNSTIGSCSDYTGSYKVPQNQGVIVYDVNGISTANFYVSSSGTQGWQLYTSTDGRTWTKSGDAISGKAGEHPSARYSGTDINIKYVKLVNTNSSARDIQGVMVYELLTPSDLTSLVQGNTIKIQPGKTYQLTKDKDYSTSCTGAITYKSTITRLVTVSDDGLITGVTEGTSTVTLTQANDETYNGGTIQFTVEVGGDTRAASDLVVSSDKELTIAKGETSQISATSKTAITYTSNAPSIASVDSEGKITATGYGKATITVASAGDDDTQPGSVTISVTVPDARTASSLAVGSTEVSVVRKATSRISVSGQKGKVTYTSDDETIATVSTEGVITAVEPGECSILVADEGDASTMPGKVYVSVTVTEDISGKTVVTFSKPSSGKVPVSSETTLVSFGGTTTYKDASYTYDGTTYSYGVKMESKTEIYLTPTSNADITLIFDAAAKTYMDKVAFTPDATTKTYKFTATGGTKYTLTKGDATNLYAVVFDFGSSTEPRITSDATASISCKDDGAPVTKEIAVSGANLTGTKLSATLNPTVEGLSVSLASEDITDGSFSTTATLTYKGTTAARGTTTLTFSDGTIARDVTVSYACQSTKEVEQTEVTGAATWDFSKLGVTEIRLYDGTVEGTTATTPAKSTDFFLLANYNAIKESALGEISPDASFDAQAMMWAGEYIVRNGSFTQVDSIKLKTTSPGSFTVTYANTGNRGDVATNYRYVKINDVRAATGSISTTMATVTLDDIPAGDIMIHGVTTDGTIDTHAMLRIAKIVFTPGATAIDEVQGSSYKVQVSSSKYLRNGKLVIVKNGAEYNAAGARMK